jgi:hypothetical protein
MTKIDTIELKFFGDSPDKFSYRSYDVYWVECKGPYCHGCCFFHKTYCASKWDEKYDCMDYKGGGKTVIFEQV